jgi:hypothetical protein
VISFRRRARLPSGLTQDEPACRFCRGRAFLLPHRRAWTRQRVQPWREIDRWELAVAALIHFFFAMVRPLCFHTSVRHGISS